MDDLMVWVLVIFGCLLFIAACKDIKKHRELKKAARYRPPNIYGAAAWAGDKTLKAAGLFKRGGILLGYYPRGRWKRLHPIRYRGTTNLLTFGSTGDGKTSQALLPVALTWPYSLIPLDPQGELVTVSGNHRKKFGYVCQINPSHMFERETRGIPFVSYNPMGRHWLIPGDKYTFSARAAKIAESCVRESFETPYWFSTSRGLLQFWIMFWSKYGKPHEQNLPHIARLITSSEIYDCMRWMLRRCDDPSIRSLGSRFVGPGADQVRSLQEVRENLRSEIAFLLDPAIAETMTGCDVTFSRCKKKVTTIYIVGSGAEETDGRVFKQRFVCMIGELLRNDAKGNVRTLIMADEYYSMRIRDGDQVFATCRKFNTQIWACMQTMDQLRTLNPTTYESFLNNSGVVQWLSAPDVLGSEYISRLGGDSEVYGSTKGFNFDPVTGNTTINDGLGQHSRKLILPHEVRELGPNEQILRVRGVNGLIRAMRMPYWKAGLRGARRNPHYRKQGLWGKVFG